MLSYTGREHRTSIHTVIPENVKEFLHFFGKNKKCFNTQNMERISSELTSDTNKQGLRPLSQRNLRPLSSNSGNDEESPEGNSIKTQNKLHPFQINPVGRKEIKEEILQNETYFRYLLREIKTYFIAHIPIEVIRGLPKSCKFLH